MERESNAKNSEIHLVAKRRISQLRISQFEKQNTTSEDKNIFCKRDVVYQVFDHSENVNHVNGRHVNNNKLELDNAEIGAMVNRLLQENGQKEELVIEREPTLKGKLKDLAFVKKKT